MLRVTITVVPAALFNPDAALGRKLASKLPPLLLCSQAEIGVPTNDPKIAPAKSHNLPHVLKLFQTRGTTKTGPA
jgi:hypothetical protein